jgi:hypothetical protein
MIGVSRWSCVGSIGRQSRVVSWRASQNTEYKCVACAACVMGDADMPMPMPVEQPSKLRTTTASLHPMAPVPHHLLERRIARVLVPADDSNQTSSEVRRYCAACAAGFDFLFYLLMPDDSPSGKHALTRLYRGCNRHFQRGHCGSLAAVALKRCTGMIVASSGRFVPTTRHMSLLLSLHGGELV